MPISDPNSVNKITTLQYLVNTHGPLITQVLNRSSVSFFLPFSRALHPSPVFASVELDHLVLCLSPFPISPLRAEDEGSARPDYTEDIRPNANNATVTASHSCCTHCCCCCCTAVQKEPDLPLWKANTHSVNSSQSAFSLFVNWINKVIV